MRDIREELAWTMRVLGRLQMADLMSHVTARLPGSPQCLVSPPGWGHGLVHPLLLKGTDVVTVTLEGDVVAGNGQPSPLVEMDKAIYRHHPDVGAVAFVCPRLTCAFGMARRSMQPLPHMGAELAERIAFFEHSGLPIAPPSAESLARTVSGPGSIVQLPGLGLVITGVDLLDLLMTAYNLEYSVARLNFVVATLPTQGLRTLTRPEIERIVRQRAGREHYRAFFASLEQGRDFSEAGMELTKPSGAEGPSEDGIRSKLAMACRILAAQGTLVAFLEHVSHRLSSSEWLMSPAFNFATMKAEDMVRLDASATWLAGPQPASFRYFHAEILRRRPDVKAIVHVHDVFGRAFAQAGVPVVPAWRNGALTVVEPHPVFDQPDLLFDEEPRSKAAETLGNGKIVHELSHGTDFVADTLEEATVRAVQHEESLRMQWMAMQLGPVQPLPEATLRDLAAYGPSYQAWWEYYAAQVRLGCRFAPLEVL